jgi:hypothetical protein
MKNIPFNQEHKEAEQIEIDQKRQSFIDSLDKKDKAKFKAVEKAVETLVKAKVPFYLFPQLPSLQYAGKEQVWQWNSLSNIIEYGQDGKPTPETANLAKVFHEAFFAFFFNQFGNMFNGSTIEEKMQSMPFFIYTCLYNHHQYLNEQNPKEDKAND